MSSKIDILHAGSGIDEKLLVIGSDLRAAETADVEGTMR